MHVEGVYKARKKLTDFTTNRSSISNDVDASPYDSNTFYDNSHSFKSHHEKGSIGRLHYELHGSRSYVQHMQRNVQQAYVKLSRLLSEAGRLFSRVSKKREALEECLTSCTDADPSFVLCNLRCGIRL
ncbi:uncharacterized protein LOC125042461 [Penaeus chinensis]|uniref:uncharacterized protein LOC125042461 n=1 Tax=Penaeus chinensis TaxID=139456 RepID=UPI001FB7939C|nr:uncharacterized protein LOC125042461 [Penaeus chinensis]